jgi:hypothetical protein
MAIHTLRAPGALDRFRNQKDNLGSWPNSLELEDDPIGELSVEAGPWIVEWCSTGEQKGVFLVDTLNCYIRRNLGVFIGAEDAKEITPWIILGVFRTSTEAREYLNLLQGNSQCNEKWRNLPGSSHQLTDCHGNHPRQ